MFLSSTRRTVAEVGVGRLAGCSPSGFVDIADDLTSFSLRSGRFGDSFDYADGDRNPRMYRVSGRVTRTSAGGLLAVTISNGAGSSCSTGTLTWRARSG